MQVTDGEIRPRWPTQTVAFQTTSDVQYKLSLCADDLPSAIHGRKSTTCTNFLTALPGISSRITTSRPPIPSSSACCFDRDQSPRLHSLGTSYLFPHSERMARYSRSTINL